MSEYRFRITQTLFGYVDREIGDQDPDEYADELIEEGLTSRDFNVMGDETEVDSWDKL